MKDAPNTQRKVYYHVVSPSNIVIMRDAGSVIRITMMMMMMMMMMMIVMVMVMLVIGDDVCDGPRLRITFYVTYGAL